MPASDEPAFPPHDNVRVNGIMFKLADIETKLIEQRNLLIRLMGEFENLKRRYPDDKISAHTKNCLATVKFAIDSTLAKAASIDNQAVVKTLLE